MTPTKSPTDDYLDIDELDRAIVNLSARINAASYELLLLIRRFDERGGWLQWGFANCAGRGPSRRVSESAPSTARDACS